MKNHLSIVVASVLVLSVSACGPTTKAPGKYESETSSVDSYGTKTTKKTYTDVSVDAHGNKKVVNKAKVTKDPKGLFNKTTATKTEVETN